MDDSIRTGREERPEKLITDYLARAQGLELRGTENNHLVIFQRADSRILKFAIESIEEVLVRQDADGNDFLQVNFLDGRKILLTEKLVGFKPAHTEGLDLAKLPRVVTTPDLVSVIEAIEESLAGGRTQTEEINVLRRVFDSVLLGAESVGFDLQAERAWLSCITSNRNKHSA